MEIGVGLIILICLLVFIWVFFEIKKMNHKTTAIFLVILLVLTYFSFTVAFKEKDVDLKSVSGIFQTGKIYFLWLGGFFSNVRTITTNAVRNVNLRAINMSEIR